MLKALLRNLYSNTVKFSKSKDIGSVLIEKCNHFVKIRVRDQGIGMYMGAIESLIIQQGLFSFTGLSLFMSNEFTPRIEQKLWVESELVIGSEFHSALTEIKYNF